MFSSRFEIQTLTNLAGAPNRVNSAVSILLAHDFGSERTGIKFDEMSHLGVLGVHLDWQRLTYQKFVAKTKENHNQNEIIASSPSSADLICHRYQQARPEIESDEN